MLYNKGNHAQLKRVQPQPSRLQGENGGKIYSTWNPGMTKIKIITHLPSKEEMMKHMKAGQQTTLILSVLLVLTLLGTACTPRLSPPELTATVAAAYTPTPMPSPTPAAITPDQDLAALIQSAADGEVLTLAPGTFSLAKGLLIDKNLTLMGSDSGQTILTAAEPAEGVKAMVVNTANTTLTLQNLGQNGMEVEAGTSGAVSLVGTSAAAAGSLLITALSWILTPVKDPCLWLFALTVFIGGVGGSLLDSWLGATVQAIFYCSKCQKETEKHPLHSCGSSTTPLRGLHWFNNDMVNLCCTLGGSIPVVLLTLFIPVF